MNRTNAAKQARILDLLDGYSPLIGKNLDGLTKALCTVADAYPGDVVQDACLRLAGICKFPPTPADMKEACDHFNAMLHPKVMYLHNGLIEMDFGHGRIDMRGLTEKEQDRVIALGGVISGRNMALLSLDEKRAALNGLPAPDSPRIEAPSPRLRSFK